MTTKKSGIGGGGTRVTEHVKSNDIFGRDESYTRTTDYSKNGSYISSTKTDHNGTQWNTDRSGTSREKIGNDGRYK